MLSRLVWWSWSLAMVLIVAGCSTVDIKSSSPAAKPSAKATPRIESPEQQEKRDESHAHFLAGMSYEQNRQIDKALAEYEKALEGDSGNEELAVDLSRRYVQRKDYDKAIAVLKKATETTDTSGLMFARLSMVYLQQGKTNDAVDASRMAIKR